MFANKFVENAYKMAKEKGGKDGLNCIAAFVPEDQLSTDAVIMTGPTSIMHFCGLPSVTVASNIIDEMGINRALIMYGADEQRLYSAALTIEKMLT